MQDEPPRLGNNSMPNNPAFALDNALGLHMMPSDNNPSSGSFVPPNDYSYPPGANGITYHPTMPDTSMFAKALTDDMRSVEGGGFKRKRLRTYLSGSSGDDRMNVRVDFGRPAMLLAPSVLSAPPAPSDPLHTTQAIIQSATQRLADLRPAGSDSDNDGDNDNDMEDHLNKMDLGDQQVVETLYEEPASGDAVDLIDARTQNWAAINVNHPTARGGKHVSPPDPPAPVNWDQSTPFDEPAGRQRRARRRVLIMGLIRETIFKLLARKSVRDPLPPPPPPALRVPTLENFAIRWEESSKSVFNRLAISIVSQKIIHQQPEMLTPEETKELPSMVASHIKYLCQCYKDQNQDDAEEFNTRRLRCCGLGTRKRQVQYMLLYYDSSYNH
ncbi:hypothetical protein BN14_08821 [Rhizoctonia solani AG-1 IB]|uniref:Uncharacterized protein n=1 Tax=Thanatephorus cucumeris (strain AG1-IB / isolate 7/3/14) TaxID=1108050 RepID=M5C5Z1_THACB|nr:hypothetical protein BN14_08821 [Rhizoctonia solani AG-1 IB]